MKINSVKNQSFGVIPSDTVRWHMAEAKMAGKNIQPLIKAMKDIYPYKYMTILSDTSEKVYAVTITDKYDSTPSIKKIIPKKRKKEFNENLKEQKCRTGRDNYYQEYDKWLFPGEVELYKRYAEPVIEPNHQDSSCKIIFSDVNGKPFNKIIGTLTKRLKEIKKTFNYSQEVLDDINKEFPEYKEFISRQEAREISNIAANNIKTIIRYPKSLY